mmetsp:Transcript_26092/g.62666  ORF Transcript_26092/g.62666 Transcript_26092/m.62666 type:complete len:217 (-) Transcript_26092:234-884(-)
MVSSSAIANLSSCPSSTKLSSNFPICNTLNETLGNSSAMMRSPCRFSPLNSPKGVSNSPNASGQVDTSTNCVGSEPLDFFELTDPPGSNRSFHFFSLIFPINPSRQFLTPSISTRPFVGLATALNKNAAFNDATALGRFPSKSVAQKTIASTSSVIVRTCTGSNSSTSTIRSLLRLYPDMTSGSNSNDALRSSSELHAEPMVPRPSSAPTSYERRP